MIKTLNDIYELKGKVVDVNQAIVDCLNSKEELDINLEIGVIGTMIGEDSDFEELLMYLDVDIVEDKKDNTLIISDGYNNYLINYTDLPNRFDENYPMETFYDFNNITKVSN